ncbi:MAG: flavodoxin family protein [Muribaculaceae bacterium]|nr:flavodoxin family protein [Muribaculaceae bacterium]
MAKILFVNGSPNRHGNTTEMARRLIGESIYDTLNLIDYKIFPLGQSFPDDQFDSVMNKMAWADVLVMGSPVYWHSMTGQFRTLLDRIYESPLRGSLSGKSLIFIFQGAGPSHEMLAAGDYTMKIFCRLFRLNYLGMVSSLSEAEHLRKKLNF